MTKRIRKNQLQKELQQKRQQRLHVLLISGLIIFAIGAVTGLAHYLTDESTLPVKVIKVGGELQYLDHQQLRALLSTRLNKNLLSLDIDEIHQQIQALPWVDDVTIQRKWPNTLLLTVREQQPIARWQSGGLVNIRGEWFEGEANESLQLPVLSGPEGTSDMLSSEYLYMKDQLYGMNLNTAQLSMSHRRSWKLELSNGLSLLLGRSQTHERLQQFMKIYQPTVAEQLQKIESVDMRYTNGFVIRWKLNSESTDTKGVQQDV
jgi:cell division protein FtsQ